MQSIPEAETEPFRQNTPTGVVPSEIAQGVNLLDEQMPGWHMNIDTATLDMANSDLCILGQLYSNYWRGRSILDLTDDDGDRMGFETTIPNYERLTELWRMLIDHRKGQTVASPEDSESDRLDRLAKHLYMRDVGESWRGSYELWWESKSDRIDFDAVYADAREILRVVYGD